MSNPLWHETDDGHIAGVAVAAVIVAGFAFWVGVGFVLLWLMAVGLFTVMGWPLG